MPCQCDQGMSPLMRASKFAASETVRLLLVKKADPTLQDIDGVSALHFACGQQGHSTVVKLLLQHGADVNVSDEEGRCCLHVCGLDPSETVVQSVSEILAWYVWMDG